jgi:hypothetical protein
MMICRATTAAVKGVMPAGRRRHESAAHGHVSNVVDAQGGKTAAAHHQTLHLHLHLLQRHRVAVTSSDADAPAALRRKPFLLHLLLNRRHPQPQQASSNRQPR